MFSIEELSILLCKLGHFDISDSEATFLNHIDNFTNIHIAVRLNHSEGFSFLFFEFIPGKLISKINYFQLP